MKRVDAAAGALGDAVFDAEDDRGAIEFFDDAAGDDSDDAAVPAFAPEDERRFVIGYGLIAAEIEDFVHDFALGDLALLVEGEEIAGDCGGFGCVLREEHANGCAGGIHAPGGVDGWCDAKADFARVWRAVANAGRFEERAEAVITRIGEAAEAVARDDAVFAGE